LQESGNLVHLFDIDKYLEGACLFNHGINFERRFEFLCHSVVHYWKLSIRWDLHTSNISKDSALQALRSELFSQNYVKSKIYILIPPYINIQYQKYPPE
jgi:hypothetical protein